MSDLDRFLKLMDDFGLKPDVEHEDGKTSVTLVCEGYDRRPPQPKVTGYSGFAAAFEFNAEGSFSEVGIWE